MKLPNKLPYHLRDIVVPDYVSLKYSSKMKKIFIIFDVCKIIDFNDFKFLKSHVIDRFQKFYYGKRRSTGVLIVRLGKAWERMGLLPADDVKMAMERKVKKEEEKARELFDKFSSPYLEKEIHLQKCEKEIEEIFEPYSHIQVKDFESPIDQMEIIVCTGEIEYTVKYKEPYIYQVKQIQFINAKRYLHEYSQ